MATYLQIKVRKFIGEKIKFMRENPKGMMKFARKINGATLAAGIGQGQGSIGNYENGHRLPPLSSLKKLCDFLGYEIAEILPEDQELRDCLYEMWDISGVEGVFENAVDLSSENNLNFTPEARRVDVIYSTELIPGQFSAGKFIKNF